MSSLEVLLFCLGVLVVCLIDSATGIVRSAPPTLALLTTGSTALLMSPQALFCVLVIAVPVPPKAIRNACLWLRSSLSATTTTKAPAPPMPACPPRIRKQILADPMKHSPPRVYINAVVARPRPKLPTAELNRIFPPFITHDRCYTWLESHPCSPYVPPAPPAPGTRAGPSRPTPNARPRRRSRITITIAPHAPCLTAHDTAHRHHCPSTAVEPVPHPLRPPPSSRGTSGSARPRRPQVQEKGHHQQGRAETEGGVLARQSDIAVHLADVRIRRLSALPPAPQPPRVPPPPPPPPPPPAVALQPMLQAYTWPAGPWGKAARVLRPTSWRWASCGKTKAQGKGKDKRKEKGKAGSENKKKHVCEQSASFKTTTETQRLLKAKLAAEREKEGTHGRCSGPDPDSAMTTPTPMPMPVPMPMPMPVAEPVIMGPPAVMMMAHVLAPASMPAPSVSGAGPVASTRPSWPAPAPTPTRAPVMSASLPPMRVRRAGESVPQWPVPTPAPPARAPTPARAPAPGQAPAPAPASAPAPAPATPAPQPQPHAPMGPPPAPISKPPMPVSPTGVRAMVPGKRIALWLEPLPDHVQVGRTFTPMAPMMSLPPPPPPPRAATPPPPADEDYDSFEEEYAAGVAEERAAETPLPPAGGAGAGPFKFDVSAVSFAPPPATGAGAKGVLKLVVKKGTVMRGRTVGPEAEKMRIQRRLERLDRDDPDR